MSDHPTGFVADESRVPDAPLVAPSATGGLLAVFRRRYLLSLLVKRELSARYQGSFLGLIWSYVQPAVRFVMYYFVMQLVVGRDLPAFAIHLFAGFVLVHYFTETFSAGTNSIVRNRALVQKLAMPREMFPVASMLVSAYHTMPQFVILAAVAVGAGWTPDWVGAGAGVLGFAIIAVFGTAMALLFSAANVYFRDFQRIVGTVTTFVHFGVPMIYPYSMVDDRFGEGFVGIYLANPLAEAVLLMQRCFWVGATDQKEKLIAEDLPDHLFTRGFVLLGVSVLLLAIAQLVFSRLENKFPERL